MRKAAGNPLVRQPPGNPEAARRGISLRGLASALTNPAIIAFLWALAIAHLVWIFTLLPGRVTDIDFSLYYTAATAVRAGVSPYTGNLEPLAQRLQLHIKHQAQLPYTPTFLLAFEPLTHFPPQVAYWIWFALSIIALSVSMFLLLQRSGHGASALGALILLYPPLAEHFLTAQTQLLVLILLVLMLLCLENGNDATAGALLASAGALRAYPLALSAYLLLLGRWRAFASEVAFLTIIALVTVLVLGTGFCENWIQGIGYATRLGANPATVTLHTFVSRFFWYCFGMKLSNWLEFFRYAAIGAAEFALLAFTAKATLSSHRFGFSVWIVAAILLSPMAWTHYLVLLFIPFGELVAAANQGMCSGRAIGMMIVSYGLTIALYVTMGAMPTDSAFRAWVWIGQGLTLSVLLAYISVYWLALDSSRIVSAAAGQDSARFCAQA